MGPYCAMCVIDHKTALYSTVQVSLQYLESITHLTLYTAGKDRTGVVAAILLLVGALPQVLIESKN